MVLAGGSPHAHDFDEIGRALVEVVEGSGHDLCVCTRPEQAAAQLAAGFDALVVDGLWWRMLGETYDQWRTEHGYSPSERTREELARFVETGGGMVALHTTPICFDDWPAWGDLVGGAWHWGQSSHPPYGEVRARLVADHPVVAGLPAEFGLRDEVYGDLDLRDDIEVLAVARRHPDDADQPVVWVHRYGDGKVVFDCFGHDAESIRDESNRRLITQAVDWVTGEVA